MKNKILDPTTAHNIVASQRRMPKSVLKQYTRTYKQRNLTDFCLDTNLLFD